MTDKERNKVAFFIMIIAVLISSHAFCYVKGKQDMHEEIAELEMKEGRILPRSIFNMTDPKED